MRQDLFCIGPLFPMISSEAFSYSMARIRALTIRQPFPELIFRKRKPYEIRSWKYRGPLLIHSATKVETDCARESGLNPELLTTSAFVGVAILSDVRPYTSF